MAQVDGQAGRTAGQQMDSPTVEVPNTRNMRRRCMQTTVLIADLRPPRVAGVEVALVVGQDVAAPQRGVHFAGARGDAPRHAADQDGRHGQARLVEQIRLARLAA